MRFPVFESAAQPGVDAPMLRKSYAYCCERVADGTHHWLPAKKDGIQANPPALVDGDDDWLTIAGDGALNFHDSVNNGIGSADEKRVAFRDDQRLTRAESLAMRKVRNYGIDPHTMQRMPSWADCIRTVAHLEPRIVRIYA
jgi:hypothetical protein